MTGISNEMAKWREERWWLKEEYVQGYQHAISPAQVNECVSEVIRVFDENWILSDPPHAAFYELFSRGTHPLNALIAIGRNLSLVRKAPGIERLEQALRDPGNYESAKLELALAAVYSERGYEIVLHPKTRHPKEADLLTRLNGQEVYFEAKIIRESQEAYAMSCFTTELGSCLSRVMQLTGGHKSALNYEIKLDSGIVKRFAKRMVKEEGFFSQLLNQAAQSISHHLKQGDASFHVPEIGDFVLAHEDVIPNSTIIGTRIDTKGELRRMVGSRLGDAIRQLHPDRPGIVVFRTQGILEEVSSSPTVEEFLKFKGEQASHVSAVVFLPVFYTLFTRWSPFKGFAVVNPFGRFPASSLEAFQTIVDECDLMLFSAL